MDSLNYRSSDAGVTVNLTTGVVSGGHAEGDIISGFEWVWDSSHHNDTLTGDGGNNWLDGGGGADRLDGGGAPTASTGAGALATSWITRTRMRGSR